MSIEDKIKSQIKDNNILIYMKGSPYEPKCGFSARTVQALIDCGAEFSYVDILENQDIRENLPSISDWPTFPQVFVTGELIGGCDIVTEMHESGDLQTLSRKQPLKYQPKSFSIALSSSECCSSSPIMLLAYSSNKQMHQQRS
jgi:monothiol glutaredoxin